MDSKSTQQFVEIEDIKDGTIILKNGALRRILMVSGINFELKSEDEQKAILGAYQNFLNSLDFSVQFVIHSRKLNIEAYLEQLKERQYRETNELLQNQMEEYAEFIRAFVEKNAVMAKTFLVVVPYDHIAFPAGGKNFLGLFGFGHKQNKASALEKTLEQKLVQLDERAEQIIDGLSQIGLRVVALNDEELTELFYNFYNPKAVERKKIKLE